MRSPLLVLVFLLIGCGKSFQEADAIYKDEVAKLKALERKISEEADTASKAAHEKCLEDNRLPAKERQASDAAVDAMRTAEKEMYLATEIAREKARLASETSEKFSRALLQGTEDEWQKAKIEDEAAKEAFDAARKAEQEAIAKTSRMVEQSKQADAAIKTAIEEIKRKAAEAGRLAEKEVRSRRLPEIQAQQEVVDAAYQAKEAAK